MAVARTNMTAAAMPRATTLDAGMGHCRRVASQNQPAARRATPPNPGEMVEAAASVIPPTSRANWPLLSQPHSDGRIGLLGRASSMARLYRRVTRRR